jgi:hypothetical protein
MSTPLLVRHPPPHPTESLAGYVLRLSEVNGYINPQSLYSLAGMNANERSWTNFACAKLAAIANQPVSSVERIAYKYSGNGPRAMALLGEPVNSRDLKLTGAKVCPSCVAENGFIEAHWHLELMVGCPVHKQAAVWFCGNCKQRVPWLRTGLLTCECGAPLANSPQYLFLEEDWWLLDLIPACLGSFSHSVTMAFFCARVGCVTKANRLVLFCKFDLLRHALFLYRFSFAYCSSVRLT